MKLNYDCVRDLLLTLEDCIYFKENLEYAHLSFDDLCKLLPKYTKSDIAYATLRLKEADYINVNIFRGENRFSGAIYSSITFSGHQYLDTVRNPKIWSKIKEKAGSLSFNIILKMSESLIISHLLEG